MKCPSCNHAALQLIRLDSQLRASRCGACEGHWITADEYWRWLEVHGNLPEKAPDEIPLEAEDTQHAKLCPRCHRIMLRYKVGHGMDFRLDQCGRCNSVWFDANEWEALKQRNLHDDIHLIFSAPWQSNVRRSEARDVFQSIYAGYFQADYDNIRQFKEWVDAHAEHAKMIAYLNHELSDDGLTASDRASSGSAVGSSMATLYADIFQADYGRLKQFKLWLEAHAQKDRILSYLSNQDPYAVGPSL
ncbi:MAG: zf-TFIIB domain-containing protein [Phormidesmis sp.]